MHNLHTDTATAPDSVSAQVTVSVTVSAQVTVTVTTWDFWTMIHCRGDRLVAHPGSAGVPPARSRHPITKHHEIYTTYTIPTQPRPRPRPRSRPRSTAWDFWTMIHCRGDRLVAHPGSAGVPPARSRHPITKHHKIYTTYTIPTRHTAHGLGHGQRSRPRPRSRHTVTAHGHGTRSRSRPRPRPRPRSRFFVASRGFTPCTP